MTTPSLPIKTPQPATPSPANGASAAPTTFKGWIRENAQPLIIGASVLTLLALALALPDPAAKRRR